MTVEGLRFPFGAPVLRRSASADEARRLFVLGAYPSALHVEWKANGTRIAALPVDNEPTPFWTGENAPELVEEWRARVRFDARFGTVRATGNGPSGRWVDERILGPLGSERSEAWITDCLDTYHASTGVMKAVQERFAPFAESVGLPTVALPSHPSEAQIVRRAVEPARLAELRRELAQCKPETIVTLGNAALRVLRELVTIVGSDPGRALKANGSYGSRVAVQVGDQSASWLALAHPAAPKQYQDVHREWAAHQNKP